MPTWQREITGKKIEPCGICDGKNYRERGQHYCPREKRSNHIVLEKGKVVNLSLPEAAKKLKAGDVVMKGANALDYKNKMAAVNIVDRAGGTTGITVPYVIARKANLIIPVGLEKLWSQATWWI